MGSTTATQAFVEFVELHERRLRQALSAALGSEAGGEATAEALAYAWENWHKVSAMENPAGYLYVLGRNRGRRGLKRVVPRLMPVDSSHQPWVEPALPGALESLSEQQRTCVMLLYSFDWTMPEVAELLGIAKSTVQTYAERGMAKLRRKLGVSS